MTVTGTLRAIERVLLTLWIGGLWATGLVFAPVLFASYERLHAGDIAGRLFSAMSLVSLACAALLLALALGRARLRALREWRVVLLGLMLMLTLIGEFVLAARMRELKALAVHHPALPAVWEEFGRLHKLAGLLYAVNCALGSVLVVAGVRPRAV